MAWTKHGHHIPGSEMSEDRPPISRCGGPGLCNACSKEASMYQNSVNKKKNIMVVDEEKVVRRLSVYKQGLSSERFPFFLHF